MKICNHCGESSEDNAVFCTNCGMRFPESELQDNISPEASDNEETEIPYDEEIQSEEVEVPVEPQLEDEDNEKNDTDAETPSEYKQTYSGEKSAKKPAVSNKMIAIVLVVLGAIAVLKLLLPLITGNNNNDSAYDDGSYYDTSSSDDAVVPPEAPDCQQELHVTCHGSQATLSLLEWDNGEWIESVSVNAYIGANGISYDKQEGDKCTPAGTFDVLYYLSAESVDTSLRHIAVNKGDTWICDPTSDYYNTIQNSNSAKDWDTSQTEDLYRKFNDGYSTACIMFNYNGNGLDPTTATAYKGSDIFIDGVGSAGNLTSGYGDIKITSSDMIKLLSLLDATKNPVLIVS